MCEIKWKPVLAGEKKMWKEITDYLVSQIFELWKRKSRVTKKKDYCENLLVSLGFTHYIVFFSWKGFCHVFPRMEEIIKN